MSEPSSVVVTFTYERDTKNKVRFSESTDGEEAIGKLYVSKDVYAALGEPKVLNVTLSRVGD